MNKHAFAFAFIFHRGFPSVALAAALLYATGCNNGASSGALTYDEGTLRVTLPNHYDAMVSATEKAISQLDLAQPEERKDALSDTFTTHTAKGDRVEINETNISDTATKLSIKVGTFGDRDMTFTIFDKIQADL